MGTVTQKDLREVLQTQRNGTKMNTTFYTEQYAQTVNK